MLSKIEDKRIAVDIDDVLAQTIPNLLCFIKDKYGLNIRYEECDNYKLHRSKHFQSLGLTKMEAHDIWNDFFDSNYGHNIDRIEWSKEKLYKLSETWWKITLITARWHSLRPHTESWIKRNYPEIKFDSIHYTWSYDWKTINKSEICLKLWIKLIIEDNIHNCLEMESNWISSYLITRPWNKDMALNSDKIIRINWWHEINEYE